MGPRNHAPVRKRLARSFVSVSVGLLVIALLAAMAALMIGTAPLWLWLAPAAVEQPATEPESAGRAHTGIRAEAQMIRP
jgi:hypothetical protein